MSKFCKHIQYVKELKALQEEAELAGATAVGISKQGNLYVYDKERRAARQVSLSRAAELLNVSVAALEENIAKVDGPEDPQTPIKTAMNTEWDAPEKGETAPTWEEKEQTVSELREICEVLKQTCVRLAALEEKIGN